MLCHGGSCTATCSLKGHICKVCRFPVKKLPKGYKHLELCTMKKGLYVVLGLWCLAFGSITLATPAHGAAVSADLNGTNAYFSASDSATLSVNGDRTVEGWIKTDANPSNGEAFDLFNQYNDVGNQRSWSTVYENNGGTLQWHLRISSNGSAASEDTLAHTMTTGTWAHYRFVYTSSAGEVEVFVDGSSIGTMTGFPTSAFNSNADVQIGYSAITAANYFNGKLSLWRVWSSVRSAADSCIVYGAATTTLVAEWELDNALTDGSGNSNTLSWNGSDAWASDVPDCLDEGGEEEPPATTTTSTVDTSSLTMTASLMFTALCLILFAVCGWTSYKISTYLG